MSDTGHGDVWDTIVVGGGIGGGFVAHKMGCRLVTSEPEFLWTPRLCEVLVDAKPSRIHTSIFQVNKNTSVAEVLQIEPEENKIITSNGTERYKSLLVACGSVPNLSIPGVKKHTKQFYTLADAEAVRDIIKKEKPKSALVIGGGPTGVEVITELKLCGIDDLTLIFGGEEVLRNYSAGTRQYAARKMTTKFGVKLINHTRIERVEDGCVFATDDGEGDSKKEYHSELIIWTAGVKPRTIPGLRRYGEKMEKEEDEEGEPASRSLGGILTNKYLQHPDWETVFAIGDCRKPGPDGASMSAASAKQEASSAVGNIRRFLRGKNLKENKILNLGMFLTLGEEAVIDSFGFSYHAFLGSVVRNTYYDIAMKSYGV